MTTIPYGKTLTYGEIAERIVQKCGVPSMSTQAVGNSIRHNPISLIILCHRTDYAVGFDITGIAMLITRIEKATERGFR